MNHKRKRYRRKRLIIAYTLRIFVLLVLLLIGVLCVSGCLYIKGLWSNKHQSISYRQDAESYYAMSERSFGEGIKGSVTIVLDAGHGGKDVGTLSGDIYEKDITIAVVKYMQELLEARGVQVLLTRDEDEYLELEKRAEIANNADADLFVSIHCNYYEKDASVKGLECYYQEGSQGGKQLAEKIMDSLKEEGAIQVRKAKEEDYSVLRNTRMTAVLVELGYMSNKKECKMLTESKYQKTLAQNLVDSILEGM